MSTESRANKEIFQVGSVVYTWRNVLACNEFLGELRPAWDGLADKIRAAVFAENDELEIAVDKLQENANELRYELNLITGEETENWLDEHDLTVADLNEHLIRNYWYDELSDKRDVIRKHIDVSPETIMENLWPTLIFDGRFEQFVVRLAYRIIVHEHISNAGPVTDDDMDIARSEFCRHTHLTRDQLKDFIRHSYFLKQTFNHYLKLEIQFGRYCDDVAPPDKFEVLLKSMRPQLIRVKYDSIEFHDLEMAKEAFLCATVDGESFADIAARAGGRYGMRNKMLKDMPGDLQRLFLSARIGEHIPPMPDEPPPYTVFQVINKYEPTLDDALVREQLRREYINGLLRPRVDQYVDWKIWHLDLSNE